MRCIWEGWMRLERNVVKTKSCLHPELRMPSQAVIAQATSSARGSILHLPPLPLTTTKPPVRSTSPNRSPSSSLRLTPVYTATAMRA
jgi:hypothetical protein